MASITHQGWMNKKGGLGGRSYQKRWFVLRGHELHYFKDQNCKDEQGVLDLTGCRVNSDAIPKFALSIEGPTLKKRYELTCLTDDEKLKWLKELERASERHEEIAGSPRGADKQDHSAPEPEEPHVSEPAPAVAAATAPTNPSEPEEVVVKKEEKKEVKPGSEVWITKITRSDQSVEFIGENKCLDRVTLRINLTATRNVRPELYPGAYEEDGCAAVVMDPEESAKICTLVRVDVMQPAGTRVGYVFTKDEPSRKFLDKQRDKSYSKIQKEIDAIKALTNETQDMEKVAQICKENNLKFVDLTFPPQAFSLDQFIWQRPEEFLDPSEGPPVLFDDCIEPNDIFQGSLGDCWFMCALATMAEFPDVVRKCLPEKPNDTAVGSYRMRICKDGWWRLVTVDDYFPCNFGRGPAYAKNKGAELWSALMEKAYAKLHGSYQTMCTGLTGQALAELTGFPYKKFSIRSVHMDTEKLWKDLVSWDDADFMMSAGTPGDGTADYGGDGEEDSKPLFTEEEYYQAGFITAHSYSVIDTAEVQGHRLLKVRNPWGGLEWNGDWSDNSPLWTDEIRQELGFEAADDGLFWMSFEDFLKYFVNVTVCYNYSQQSLWRDMRIQGEFSSGQPNYYAHIHINNTTKAFISLYQRDKRGKAKGEADWEYYELGFMLLRPEGENGYGVHEWTGYRKSRDVWVETTLEANPRPYILIPSTCMNEKKPFVTGVLTEQRNFGKIEFKKYDPTLLESAMRVATYSRGKERVWSEENGASVFTYSAGRWLGLLAVNKGNDKHWNIRMNCEEAHGYKSLRPDGLMKFEGHIPKGSTRYLGTFYAEKDTLEFAYQLQHQFTKKGDEPGNEGFEAKFDISHAEEIEVHAQVDGGENTTSEVRVVSRIEFSG